MAAARPLRFLAGLAFVAAGVTLAAPPAGRIARALQLELAREQVTARDAGGRPPEPPAPVVASGSPVEPTPAVVRDDSLHAVGPTPADLGPASTGSTAPPWGAGWEMAAPALGHTYRSALEAPPPPLLDESPTAPRPALTFTGRATAAARAAPGQTPPTYRVRDGDDLASIAERHYGHPGAASRLWAANRDRLPDPAILPIGMELQLPPSWEIDDASRSGGQAIEPRAAGR